MSGISVWVDGAPKGQPRPRAFVFRGHARVYDAGTAEGWKAAVATALKPWAQARMEGPLRVALCFQFLRPASHRLVGAWTVRGWREYKPSLEAEDNS